MIYIRGTLMVHLLLCYAPLAKVLADAKVKSMGEIEVGS